MHYIVGFFTFLPLATLFVAVCLTRDTNKIDVAFLRSLEFSAMGLIVCYVLHVTGIVHSTSGTITGAILWAFCSFVGEFARRAEKRKPADSPRFS